MNLSIKNNYINRILEREKLLLWSIFSLGLLLRIAFIILWDRRPNFDTQNYIAQAEAILTGNPASGFPNGYPLIIAAVIFLTGKNLIFPAMISLNLLAQLFTGYFLYKISKLLFPESPNYPTTNNQQPTTNNQHPTTNNQQPTTNNQQPITNNQHPTTNNQHPTTNNQQPITNNQQPITNNQQPITNNQQLITILVLFLFALYPTQILYTNSVLTETITTLFITASVYSLLINSYFTGGLTLAIASMIRTSFLPALIITFLYILYKYIRTNQQSNQHPITNNQHPITNTQQPITNNQQPITNNHHPITNNQQPITNNQQPITNNQQPITNNHHPITQSPFMKYLAGLALVLSFFALLDFTGITKFPENQNYNLLIAINGRSSSINHNISNFSESDFVSPLQTYINFAYNNTKEFIIQRADALWGLWGVFPFETNHLYSKLLLSIRTFLFLSWLYWLYILIRKKEIWKQNLFNLFFICLSILIVTITIIHTLYFSSFRFIVPLEPVLLIILVFTIFRFFTVNQSINQPITNNQ